jgi:hypothetical protein
VATITNSFSVQQLIGPDGPQTTGILLFLWLLSRIAAWRSRYTMPIRKAWCTLPGLPRTENSAQLPFQLGLVHHPLLYLLSRILFHASRCFFAVANNSAVSPSINMDSITSFC